MQKSLLLAALTASTTLGSLALAPSAEAALLWNFTYTATNVDNGNPGTLNVTLTTDGTAYQTGTTYNIQSVSGTAGSNPISLFSGNLGGFPVSNFFQWDGSTGIIVDDGGLAFEGPSGFINNFFLLNVNQENSTFNGSGTLLATDQSPTNISLTPVPEPLTLLGASAAIGFGAAFKRKSKA